MKKQTITKGTEVNGKRTKAIIRIQQRPGYAADEITTVKVGETTKTRYRKPQNEFDQRTMVEETAEAEEERIYRNTRTK